jgi:hypothetical protein
VLPYLCSGLVTYPHIMILLPLVILYFSPVILKAVFVVIALLQTAALVDFTALWAKSYVLLFPVAAVVAVSGAVDYLHTTVIGTRLILFNIVIINVVAPLLLSLATLLCGCYVFAADFDRAIDDIGIFHVNRGGYYVIGHVILYAVV